jgi:hypothetical protein
MAALTTVDLNPGTHYEINITGNITLTAGTMLPAINTTSPLIINGNNFTVNGGGVQQGFFVYSGTVAINKLAIINAAAVGGSSHGRRAFRCQRRQRHGQQCQLIEQ